MTALGLLVRHRLRRDRVQTPAWIVSIAGLIVLAAVGLQDAFGSVAERTALIALAAANPGILLLRGAPQGTDIDAVLIFTLFSFLGIHRQLVKGQAKILRRLRLQCDVRSVNNNRRRTVFKMSGQL